MDLEVEFYFIYFIMIFKIFCLVVMLIEWLFDFGKIWGVYRYFVYDCEVLFLGILIGFMKKVDDIICDFWYFDIEFLIEGEVIFCVLDFVFKIEDFYSLRI